MNKITLAGEQLPKNTRTTAILQKREEIKREEQERKAEEDRRIEQNKAEQKRKDRKKEEEKRAAETAKREADRRKQEQDKAATEITGRLRAMLIKLRANETPKEYSFAAINLGGART